jgi:dsRNA-specific ribonuclease
MEVTSSFIENIFRPINLKLKYLNILTSVHSIQLYNIAFTAKTFDPENNYEFYEFIGDSEINNCIVWYFYKTFPNLEKPKNVVILSRLKNQYISSSVLSLIAEKLNFWPYIKYGDVEIYEKRKKCFLEDVFESFIGVTKMILVNHFGFVGVANQIIFDFICHIFDEMNISIDLNNLIDQKTILKELFDNHESLIFKKFGPFHYEQKKENNKYITILKFPKENLFFKTEGEIKRNREQEASKKALNYFKEKKYYIDKKITL